MNNRTKIIAAVSAVAAVIGGVQYKQHVDFWAFYDSCQEAREVRRDATRFLGRTISDGNVGFAAEATALLQDVNEVIANCNAQGV